jgi:hypothetical protein
LRNLDTGNPPGSRETHRPGQDTTIGVLALPHGNLPARTCTSSSPNPKRFSPGISLSLSPATTSPAASTLSRFRSAGSLDPAARRRGGPADFRLAAVVCSLTARPGSASVCGSATWPPPAAAQCSLCSRRRTFVLPLPPRWSLSSQLHCKVCGRFSQLARRHRPAPTPYCVPTATAPSTARNNAPTPPSTSALATAALTTSQSNKL